MTSGDVDSDKGTTIGPRRGRRTGTSRVIILAMVVLATIGVIGARLFDDGGENGMGGMGRMGEPAVQSPQISSLAQDVPSPSECQVEPRAIAEMQALLATPTGSLATPAIPSQALGTPADPATIETVVATYRMLTACLNAGDFSRAFALYTDEYVRLLLNSASTRTGIEPGLVAIALATPIPSSPMGWTAIVAIGNVQVVSDDRASAFVVTAKVQEAGNPAAERPRLVFLVQREGRWLIDAIVDPSRGATPAATP